MEHKKFAHRGPLIDSALFERGLSAPPETVWNKAPWLVYKVSRFWLDRVVL